MIRYFPLFFMCVFLYSLPPAIAEPLRFETQIRQTIPFEVEIARTEEDQNRGLMNRDSLPPGTGMLFIFDPPSKPIFWMKDTKIKLDMIYINEDGIVIHIHENAVPFDKTLIYPPKIKSKAVLEIGGGLSKKLGISKGDKVIHTIFAKEVK